MKKFLLLIMLTLLLLTACDDRGSENPKMYVSIPDDQPSYVFNHPEHNEMEIEIQLDGPLSKLIERRVDVSITNQMGNFIGTGNSQSLLTDDQGFASGRFLARDGYGIANVEFVLETWPSEKTTLNIPIFDFPRIDSLVAGTYTLNADGTSSTSLTAYVSSDNIDFSEMDIEVEFIASNAEDGYIIQPVARVDVEGIASSNFKAPTSNAYVTIRAELKLDSDTYKSINIKCERP
jgi:hypothetical protein